MRPPNLKSTYLKSTYLKSTKYLILSLFLLTTYYPAGDIFEKHFFEYQRDKERERFYEELYEEPQQDYFLERCTASTRKGY